uniref:1,3-beta-glucan synthase n=1 Tax=Spongospora subterranea TaxID=70186 RepID=A0A0H5RK18_9EUKA|eukprot:CRZ09069.1 hypothetical protein [Spongospora subterranea]
MDPSVVPIPDDPTPISFPEHALRALPVPLIILGGVIALFGRKLRRLYALALGIALGLVLIHAIVPSATAGMGSTGALICICIIGVTISGLLCILIRHVASGAALGAAISLIALIIFHRAHALWFRNDFVIILLVALVIIMMIVAVGKPTVTMTISSSVVGSLGLIIGIDGMISARFTTFLVNLLTKGIESDDTGDGAFFPAIIAWGILSVVSIVVQHFILGPEVTKVSLRSTPAVYKADKMFIKRSTSTANMDDSQNHASFNYIDYAELPPSLVPVDDKLTRAFNEVSNWFGFQTDNRDNQKEHVLFLLSSMKSHGNGDFVERLHVKIFENYRAWCSRMKVREALLWKSCGALAALWDLALYMSIWGEASNLRHCPELICYLFHQTSSEAQGGQPVPSTKTPPGTFLAAVVRPIYDVIVSQPKGDHTANLNYDDINEFFWNKSCLKYHHSAFSLQTQTPHRYGAMPGITVGLLTTRKTYIERRSWLHPFKSFFRVFSFMAISFHVLTCIAFLEFYGSSISSDVIFKALGSVLLTMSFMNLAGELLYLWGLGGMETPSTSQTFGCFLRLLLKAGLFISLTLYYVWSFTTEFGLVSTERSWLAFQHIAFLYLVPCILCLGPQLIPVLGQTLTSYPPLRYVSSIWWPSHNLYVGNNMAEHERDCFKYQVFWITLFACKFTCSFFFQIRPLIYPTIQLLMEPSHQNVLFPYSQFLLLFSLWLPFVFIYLIDLSVWYAIWSAGVGAFVGVSQKLGEIRYFSMIQTRFMDIASEFEKKLINKSSHSVRIRVDSGRSINRPSLKSLSELAQPLLASESPHQLVVSSENSSSDVDLSSETWTKFSEAWAGFIKDMRYRDLLSNSERDMLSFRMQDDKLRLPLFLCAGALDNALQLAIQLDAERRADGVGTRSTYELNLTHVLNSDPNMKDSIAQLWTASNWILKSLLGQRHEKEINTLLDHFLNCYRRQSVLENYDVRKFALVKEALLDLVRLLVVAVKQKQKPDTPEPAGVDPVSHPRLLSKMSGHSIKREQSSGMLLMLTKLGKNVPLPHGEVRILRTQVRTLLDVVKGCSQRSEVVDSIKLIVSKPDGFFHNEDYTLERVYSLLVNPNSKSEISSLYTLLTLAAIDARPKSYEARRRMQCFVNSLFMDMPAVRSVKSMHSWSILTPFYSEDVIYSRSELLKETEDGVSPLLYLKTIFSDEWANFCERVGADPLDNDVLDSDKGHQAQLWATNRGQTLFRTVAGMMQHDEALQLLAHLEDRHASPQELSNTALQKFTYIVTCQRYGMQKRTGDPRASDIDFMLSKYPTLRVAYIDTVQVAVHDDSGATLEIEEHFSVLIKSVMVDNIPQIQEVYRIKLPGNPIVGEGKPENQNHAVIFTRGEMLQTVDMNQDAYFEEALKMRNMLQEFDQGTADRPITIVGFAEHIFTSRLSSIANYMALQEGVFVTLGQRVLANPLRIRMHYGHPDVFDKIFHLTRGGVSKASRGINLSEDIFAGYNTTLRGGSVVFKEFMEIGKGRDVGLQQLTTFEAKLSQGAAEQSFSRDVARIADKFDFFRLMSFYTGGLGFYFNNSFTILAVFFLVYSKLLWSLFGFTFMDMFAGVSSGAYWFGMVGFLTTLPILATLGVNRGFRTAAVLTMQMLLTGGPLFFCFAMATKAHYFERTVLAGGAKYRPTGRGFITKHEAFAEIYRFHASSHFSKALELYICLILYHQFTVAEHIYWTSMWPVWMLAISWSFAPFWFNPMAFEWEKTVEDATDFLRWMHRKEGASGQSWQAWFEEENSYQKNLDWQSRLMLCIAKQRYVLIGLGLLNSAQSTFFSVVSCSVAVVVSIALPFIFRCHRYSRSQCVGRSINAVLSLLLTVLPIAAVVWAHVQIPSIEATLQTILGIMFCVAAFVSCLMVNGARWSIVIQLCKVYHYCLGLSLLIPVVVLALLYFPAYIQTRLTFHNAFSKGLVVDDLLRGSRKGRRQQSAETISQIRTQLEKQQRIIEEISKKKNADNAVELLASDRRPIPATVSATEYSSLVTI